MKSLVLLTVLFGFRAFAEETKCPPATTVYRCEKIISESVIGPSQEKLTSASYRVWLVGEGAGREMRIDGKLQWGSHSSEEAQTPQGNKNSSLAAQKIIIEECMWRLNETLTAQVVQAYSNYPKNPHDHIKMDLKNSELSVELPVGIKSYATLKLSCVVDSPR